MMRIDHKLAAQLYTLREFTKTAQGFRESLRRCAEMGYKGVQISAVGAMNDGSVSAPQAREWLDEFGLVCVATHRPWSAYHDTFHAEVAMHKTLGCSYTAVGWMDQSFQDRGREGFRDYAAQCTELARKFAPHGIRFGYHNHAFEFKQDEHGPLYDEFLTTDPVLQLEIDTYWVHMGGFDPVETLAKAADRVDMIHVKDAKPNGDMAAVGEGVLDWCAVVDLGETIGVEWYIVEQDECDRDPFECLRSSYEYLAKV